MGRVKVSHNSRLIFLSKSFFLLALMILPGFVSSALAISVSLSITSVEKSEEKKGYIIKGEVTASDLNPKGQIVESDSMTIFADIKIDSGSVYQELPEGMYIRKPAGCESSYTKGKKCMTLKEERGVCISRGVVTGLGDIRISPVWRAYGGLGVWDKKAPKSVTKTFEGVIPFTRHYKGEQIQVEGKEVRIRATLQHRWGGPYAAWPAFSFHHDIGFEGVLQTGGMSVDQKDEDEDGVPDDFDKCCKTPKGNKVDKNGCTVCPGGMVFDFELGCSKKRAIIFMTVDDPDLDWRHQLFMLGGILAVNERYIKEGYETIIVPLSGKKVGKEWHSDIKRLVKFLTRPSTKAIAFFGHGGKRTEEVNWWPDTYIPTLGGHTASELEAEVMSHLATEYIDKYCMSKIEAWTKANQDSKNIGLEDAYMYACHSLDNNSLRNFLVSPDKGVYWGDTGIYFGVLELKEVIGKGK